MAKPKKPETKQPADKPDFVESSGRDPVTGLWLPGHKGIGGRPKGFDFRAVVAERVKLEGKTVEDVIWEIFGALYRQAKIGDVVAAKFLVERLCGKTPEALDLDDEDRIPDPRFE